MGTIGGNVLVDTRCNYYDQTFFLASGGRLLHEKGWRHLFGRAGQRKVPRDRVLGYSAGVGELGSGSNFGESDRANGACKLADLYRDDGIDYSAKTARRSTQRLADSAASRWAGAMSILKLRRRGSFDFPILGVAATLDIDEHGECRDATVVLTAVASAPKIVTEATTLLQGKKITLELIDAVADAAAKDRASARQRRLGLLVSQAHGESVYAKSFGAGGRFRSIGVAVDKVIGVMLRKPQHERSFNHSYGLSPVSLGLVKHLGSLSMSKDLRVFLDDLQERLPYDFVRIERIRLT